MFNSSGTACKWNGQKFSERDKVESNQYAIISKQFKSTSDIINNIDTLPDKIMFTIHPERWNDSVLPWAKELILQNVKNVVKRMVVKDKRIKSKD